MPMFHFAMLKTIPTATAETSQANVLAHQNSKDKNSNEEISSTELVEKAKGSEPCNTTHKNNEEATPIEKKKNGVMTKNSSTKRRSFASSGPVCG